MSEVSYGVLLVAYGAPRSLEEVKPFLEDIRSGRPTPPELVAELEERYRAIGGGSPLLERTEAQAARLAHFLGDGTPVYVGMRHWHPYIREALEAVRKDGIKRLVVVAMAPHFSRMSIGAYQKKVEEASEGIEVAFVKQWYDHPRFLDGVAAKVAQTLERFPAARRTKPHIIFTAHSLPEKILASGDPYPEQLRRSAEGVMERVGDYPYSVAFQSAGQTQDRWLGPDAGEVMQHLAAQGHGEIVLCPIGFVADHLEVLYDVDIEYQDLARKLGVRLERTPSLNDSPELIEALADLVRTAAAERGWIAPRPSR
ncbi:MAG: ferrochelatase [Gemmatimonadales bacterium]|nr:MAG: ferrochelatase [Gemmatimonadales bacterium]